MPLRHESGTKALLCCSWQVNWPQGTLVPSYARVRYLYQPGKLEGGRRRATDPVWSLSIHTIRNAVRQSGHPALYYLTDGPPRGFVREELLIVPPGTESPGGVLTRPAAR